VKDFKGESQKGETDAKTIIIDVYKNHKKKNAQVHVSVSTLVRSRSVHSTHTRYLYVLELCLHITTHRSMNGSMEF
jgi:hypothetical protein